MPIFYKCCNILKMILGKKFKSSINKYVDNSVKNAKTKVNNTLEKVDKIAHKVWDGRFT